MSLGAAFLGSGFISGIANIIGAQAGANAQTAGLNKAIALQKKVGHKIERYVKPYLKLGTSAAGDFRRSLPGLTAPVDLSPLDLTQQNLEATPGYQFTLGQGVKSVKNALIAGGKGGQSGALVKGAEEYAAGLADKTFGERYAQAIERINLAFKNKGLKIDTLQHLVDTASGATTNTGNTLAGLAGTAGSGLASIGQARAGADVATGNAVGDISNSLVSGLLTNGLLGSGAAGQRSSSQSGVYTKPSSNGLSPSA